MLDQIDRIKALLERVEHFLCGDEDDLREALTALHSIVFKTSVLQADLFSTFVYGLESSPEVPLDEDLQVYLTALDLYYELVVRPFFKARSAVLEQAAHHLPMRTDDEPGHHWQDADGVVYELVPYDGQFVRSDPARVVRTRRGFAGEKRAIHSLSRKAAEALGYDLGSSYALVENDPENQKDL